MILGLREEEELINQGKRRDGHVGPPEIPPPVSLCHYSRNNGADLYPIQSLITQGMQRLYHHAPPVRPRVQSHVQPSLVKEEDIGHQLMCASAAGKRLRLSPFSRGGTSRNFFTGVDRQPKARTIGPNVSPGPHAIPETMEAPRKESYDLALARQMAAPIPSRVDTRSIGRRPNALAKGTHIKLEKPRTRIHTPI